MIAKPQLSPMLMPSRRRSNGRQFVGNSVWIGGSGAALMPTLPDGVRAFLDIREPTELVRELSQRERVGGSLSKSG